MPEGIYTRAIHDFTPHLVDHMVFMRRHLQQLVASYLGAQAFQSCAAWARGRNQGLNSLEIDSVFAI